MGVAASLMAQMSRAFGSEPQGPLFKTEQGQTIFKIIVRGLKSIQSHRVTCKSVMLAVARKQATSQEILLWMTPSEAPKALQASECSELLDPMRASCWISAQH